jgi:purine nucleosidase
MAVPLILDVDTGVDDLVAIVFALGSPEVDLIAATSVTGNVDVDKATRNTLLTLETAGRADVEVARGAERPLVQPWSAFGVVHGEEGLGHHEPAPPVGAPSARDGATLIAEEARRRPGEILLVSTGPLTNVALALELEPRLPELLRGYTLMGGAFREGGNVTPRAEANVWMDPEAAARVFDAWSGAGPAQLPRCLGLDVTEDVWISMDDVAEACEPAPASPLGRLLTDAVRYYADFYASTARYEGACMHDALAVAAAIDPAICAWADTRVEVELDGRWTRGETVTDLLGIRTTPWSDWQTDANACVATAVDAALVRRRMIERMRTVVEARA